MNKHLIFLMGPTAVGKTDFALKLAEHLPVEIISVDSALVYRGMDIGTGKPSREEQEMVPHHLIDIRDPSEPYSAADFQKDALRLIEEVSGRGKIPLLVGGTGLYFRALEGLSPLPSANPEIRAQLLDEGSRLGWVKMHERLREVDPDAAKRIHPNDPQRIQRALEVYEITGIPMTQWWKEESMNSESKNSGSKESLSKYRIHRFALMPRSRQELHEKIEKRFYKMLDLGFVKEAEALYKRGGLSLDLPSMRAVGYRQIYEYLSGNIVYEEMVKKGIAATRQLAKRQLTWLRGLQQNIIFLENDLLQSLQTMINCVA